MLRLAASWVWDFWIADDGEDYHVFFLKASRALLDPNRRHWRATIGHATSKDLAVWTEHADAVIPDDSPAFEINPRRRPYARVNLVSRAVSLRLLPPHPSMEAVRLLRSSRL